MPPGSSVWRRSDSPRVRRSEACEGFSNGCSTSNELLNCVEPGTHVKRYLVRSLQGVRLGLVATIIGVLVHRPCPEMVVSSELASGTPHGCSRCCRRKFSRRWNRQNAAGGGSLSSLAEQGAPAWSHHSGLWRRVHVVATGRLA